MICGSGGSKSRLAKAAGAEPAGQMRDEKLHAVVARSTFPKQNVQNTRSGPLLEVAMSKKCTPLWREAHFEVKMYKTHQVRTTFGSWDVEKVHAVVARSIFRSQNVKSTRGSDHFWRFRCRKSARRCGAKHISKSMLQTPGVRTTFGGSDVASRGRRKGLCTLSKVSKNVRVLQHFQLQPPLHPHYTPIHSLHYNYNYNYTFTTFYYTTPHYTTLHSITLNYIQLHYTTLHTLHYTTLHYTTLHYTPLHHLPSTTLHYITLHYTPQHYSYNYTTTLHYTPLHSTTLNYTPLH